MFGFDYARAPRPPVSLPVVAPLVVAAATSLFLPLGLVYLRGDITVRMGVGPLAIGFLVVLVPLAAAAATVPAVRLVARFRSAAVAPALFGVAYATVAAAFAPGQLALALALAICGAGLATVGTASRALLADVVPPTRRAQAFAAQRAAELAGGALAVQLAAVMLAGGEVTWRAVLIVLGTLGVAAGVAAGRLRSGRAGEGDAAVLAAIVDGGSGAMDGGVTLGVAEGIRQVWQASSFRALMAASGALGLLLLPLPLYLLHWFDERWHISAAAGGDLLAAVLFLAAVTAVAASLARVGGLGALGPDPRRAARRAGLSMAVGGVILAVSAWMPYLAVATVTLTLAYACVAVAVPIIDTLALSVVDPERRPEAAALLSMGTFLGMALGGVAVLAGIDSRFGPSGAIVVAGVALLSAGSSVMRAGDHADGDVDRIVDSVVDRAEVGALTRSGRRLPMLACRGIDFSYGQLQVLFGVDFTIDDGEMVALLGTNGAGKSTLLRVIAGLGIPQRGTIRFNSRDITGVDAERRMRLGMTQVPGGKGVYGQLSVVENLRVFAYSHSGDHRRVEAGVDAALGAFPRLGERRNQQASTLSGGEQQMLNLARAYVLRPRLLLIDELSLGLAPVVVGELLESVRQINATGTAVVIVEQSVNIALSLVHHAYFMEKGEIRFDGPAPDLLGRQDLLRAVFLHGAGARVGG